MKNLINSLVLTIFFSSSILPQQQVITPGLDEILQKASDSELIRILIHFSDKKIFTLDENLMMQSMTRSEKQTYFARSLKQFADDKHANVLGMIRESEKKGNAKIMRHLWAANSINC